MLTDPNGLGDGSENSEENGSPDDQQKSAFMEIQQPYSMPAAAAAMRGTYNQYMQNQFADIYSQHATNAHTTNNGTNNLLNNYYPFSGQYGGNHANPFPTSFTSTGMTNMGTYHQSTAPPVAREGEFTQHTDQ